MNMDIYSDKHAPVDASPSDPDEWTQKELALDIEIRVGEGR
jgi:hypothetical protein